MREKIWRFVTCAWFFTWGATFVEQAHGRLDLAWQWVGLGAGVLLAGFVATFAYDVWRRCRTEDVDV